MVCYPEVQKKAQEELDKVLNGRLPEYSDIVSLPYFSALVKEVYRYGEVCFKDSLPHAKHVSVSSRWHPVTPLGTPLFS
jgi:Cytochrome P450